MLGWEFPPFFAGGIGIVCYELCKALSEQGAHVTYLMPFGPKNSTNPFLDNLIIAENTMPTVDVHRVPTLMSAYMSSDEYDQEFLQHSLKHVGGEAKKTLYGKNLMQEVHNFAHRAMSIGMFLDFDVIHCHDWMTIPAAVGLKQRTGKPLVVHIHNTIFDRYLSGDNNVEYDIEQLGAREADKIVCVSHFVKKSLIEKYDVDPAKITVVHNAAQQMDPGIAHNSRIREADKIVLFAGRVTIQKGPEYFIRAARLVVDHDPNVKFVMAGTGDMLPSMIELATNMGLAEHFIFTGFYTREDAERLFSMADVFVMPSVSEPFGIVPLEAMSKGTPAIISKQSGVSEVLNHVLKVDFWDVEELAEKILSVLAYEELHDLLKKHGSFEVSQLTWDKTAARVRQVYEEVLVTRKVR